MKEKVSKIFGGFSVRLYIDNSWMKIIYLLLLVQDMDKVINDELYLVFDLKNILYLVFSEKTSEKWNFLCGFSGYREPVDGAGN